MTFDPEELEQRWRAGRVPNQLDPIDPLIRTETERAVVSRIVSQRRNLRAF
jgi:hypothetical protein